MAFAHFLSTGEDNDPYFDVYFAHELPPIPPSKFASFRYCPAQTGDDPTFDCEYCDLGFKLKKRMGMWFYVEKILHKTVRPEDSGLTQVSYGGQSYYQRDINGFKLWDTSAWQESCLQEIMFLAMQLSDPKTQITNLRKQQVIIVGSGEGTARRYHLYANQNTSPLDPTKVADGIANCKPILTLLSEGIEKVPTQTNPMAFQPPQQAQPAPVSNPFPPAQVVTPPAGTMTVPPPATVTSQEFVVNNQPQAPVPAPGKKAPGGFASAIAAAQERGASKSKLF